MENEVERYKHLLDASEKTNNDGEILDNTKEIERVDNATDTATIKDDASQQQSFMTDNTSITEVRINDDGDRSASDDDNDDRVENTEDNATTEVLDDDKYSTYATCDENGYTESGVIDYSANEDAKDDSTSVDLDEPSKIGDGDEDSASQSKVHDVYYFNRTFQQLLRENDSATKFLKLQQLVREFVETAEAYGKVIISEFPLPDEKKTIKPTKSLGVAGGDKYICAGILFKFATDVCGNNRWIYGGTSRNDDLAMKSVNHELRGIISFLQVETDFCVPLMAVISHNGYKLAALSILPIRARETLRYGSSSGKFVTADEDIALLMAKAASSLNLKGHYVKASAGKPVFIYGPADLEVHHGTDGNTYLLDFARLWPCEAPSPYTQSICSLAHRLRPELVRANKIPLSSDAFSKFETAESRTVSDHEVAEVTKRLHTKVIPRFASMIDNNPPESPQDLIVALHRHGINCRHLGRVLRFTKSSETRALLYEEMTARAVKARLRYEFRQLRSSEDIRQYVAATLRALLGGNKASHQLWTVTIPQLIQEKFDVQEPNVNIRDIINICRFITRLADSLGLVLSKRCTESLQKYGVYSFGLLDLLQIVPVVKHMNIVDYAEGMAHYFLSKEKTVLEEKRELLQIARDKFEKVLLAAPFDTNSSHKFGLMQYKLAKLTFDDNEFNSLVASAIEALQSIGVAGYGDLAKLRLLQARRFGNIEYLREAASLLQSAKQCFEEELLSKALSKQGSLLLWMAKLSEYHPRLRAKFKTNLVKIDFTGVTVINEPIDILRSLIHTDLVSNCTTVVFPYQTHLSDDEIIPFIQHLANVEYLNLNGCNLITDATLEAIAKHCTRLKTLLLNSCELITDAGFETVATACTQLQEVDLLLTGCTKQSVLALMENSSDVKVLRYGKRVRVDFPGSSDELALLASTSANLTKLTMAGINLRESTYKTLFSSCDKLTEISLRNVRGLTTEALVEFVQSKGTNLVSIYVITSACSLDWSVLPHVAACCPKLEQLSLLLYDKNPTHEQIATIGRLEQVKKLNLLAEQPLPFSTILQASKLKHLEYLTLPLQMLDSVSFRYAVRNWPKLKKLKLLVSQFDTKPIDWAELGRSCPQLERLKLDKTTTITDACLLELAQATSTLRKLVIPMAFHVTEASLVPLLKHNPRMKELHISGVKLTGKAFVSMAAAAPKCEILYLQSSSGISDEHLVTASYYLHNITSIDLGSQTIRLLSLPTAATLLLNLPMLREAVLPSRVSWIVAFMSGRESISSLLQPSEHNFMVVKGSPKPKKFLVEGAILFAQATQVDGSAKLTLLRAAAQKFSYYFSIESDSSFLNKADIQAYLPEFLVVSSECSPIRSSLYEYVREHLTLKQNALVTSSHLERFINPTSLSTICLHGCYGLDEAGLLQLASRLNLITLEAVDTPAFTFAAVAGIVHHSARSLTRLVVLNCQPLSVDTLATVHAELFLQAKHLKELRLSGCWHWEYLKAFCTGMPQLRILDIPDFVCISEVHTHDENVTNDIIESNIIEEQSPVRWFEGYNELEEFSIGAVNVRIIDGLARNCTNLRSLRLRSALYEDLKLATLLTRISSKRLELRKARLVDAENWTLESFSEITHLSLVDVQVSELEIETILRAGAQRLRFVELLDIPTLGLPTGRALETLQCLTTLRVYFHQGIDNESIALCLQRNEGLRCLAIGGSQLRYSLHNPIVQFGTHLKELELYPCYAIGSWSLQLSDYDLLALATSMTALESLKLPMTKVSDIGVEALAKLTSLHTLHLSTSLVRDTGLLAFVRSVTGLCSLHIAHCTNITDTPIEEIARILTRLTALSVAHCSLLTEASVNALVRHAHALRWIDISYCDNISKTVKDKLRNLSFKGPKQIIAAHSRSEEGGVNKQKEETGDFSAHSADGSECNYLQPTSACTLYICNTCNFACCLHCAVSCHIAHDITMHSIEHHGPRPTYCQCGERGHNITKDE